MRVAIDATFLGTGRGGDETFLLGLLDGVARRAEPGDRFPLLLADGTPPDAVPGGPLFPVVRAPRRPGPVHFAATLPRALRRHGPFDLVVSVTHAPLVGATPSALVLGDLSFLRRPQDYPARTALRLRSLVAQHVRRARAVLVPSQYTRNDVVDAYDLDPRCVHVVPNRVAPPAALAAPDAEAVATELAARGVRPPYLLYLGNLHPRKNVPLLIRSFLAARQAEPLLADHRLVVAGARWFGGAAEEDAAGGDPAVVFLGRVSDRARTALLAGAEGLGYVSLFEGFGLPPLEAMAYGVPVLTSATTSLPEVAGDAAVLVEPTDADAVTDGVLRILTDERLRSRLRVAGPARAAQFDADRVGRAAIPAFAAALAGPGAHDHADLDAGRDSDVAAAQHTAAARRSGRRPVTRT